MNNQPVNSGKQQKPHDPNLAAAGIAMKRGKRLVNEPDVLGWSLWF